MDPHDVAGPGDLQNGFGEQAVYPLVGGPGVRAVVHEIGEVVEQGPEGVVAEAFVESLGVLGGEEDGERRVLLAAAAPGPAPAPTALTGTISGRKTTPE